jgi:hypothetical protein
MPGVSREKRKEVEAQLAGIDFGDTTVESHALSLPDIHDEVVAVLRAAGYDTVEKLLEADDATLVGLPGFDAETVEAVKTTARQQLDEALAAAEAARQAAEEAPAPESEEDAAAVEDVAVAAGDEGEPKTE